MRRMWLLAVGGLLAASTAWGAVPNTMNVQGRLLSAGSPMSGTHPATFKIYDAATGGALLWTEDNTLDVLNGVYSVILGQTTPLPTLVFSNQSRWLEVTVEGTTLSPRLGLTTSAYAFWAQRADTADVALSGASGNEMWTTDGTNVWRRSGRVGIGTNSPNQPLGVQGMLGVYPQPWVQPATKGMFLFHDERGGSTIYSYDYPGGHGDTLGLAAASIGFDTYGADGLYSGNKMWISQEGRVGIGTSHPTNQLDIRTSGSDAPLQWMVDNGPYVGSYVKFINNNARGGIVFGNPNPWGVEPADEAAILQSTGGWQWSKQLNIMGRVGINTNAPTATLTVNGDLSVSGTKCRAVEGTRYGTLYFNAVESGTADFTDCGEGRLVNGACHIECDPRWLAGVTIDDAHPMQVTITAYYGPHGGQEYVERTKSGFTLIDPSGSHAAFGWKVEARQKGYEDVYLNRPESVVKK